MNNLANPALRDGLAPFKYGSSEDLIEMVPTAFYPDRSFPSNTPAETILLSGIRALSKSVGNGESTFPVNDPLLTELVEVSRGCADPEHGVDHYSREYILVWRDVVICYYSHIKRSAAISRSVSFAEVDQALLEIGEAFNAHGLRLQGTQKHFPLMKNAEIQRVEKSHKQLLEQKQTLKLYWEKQNEQPSNGATGTSSEGQQD